ncbi:MAG: hypothetical protein AAF715_21820 [Myxococcota bacterium]
MKTPDAIPEPSATPALGRPRRRRPALGFGARTALYVLGFGGGALAIAATLGLITTGVAGAMLPPSVSAAGGPTKTTASPAGENSRSLETRSPGSGSPGTPSPKKGATVRAPRRGNEGAARR